MFKARGFQFPLMTDISNWYLGFNMLDPVVGAGATPEQAEKNRKLRQALAIVIDYEEGYGRIFKHKGGVAAHSPLPPGLFGSREGQGSFHNPVTHKLVDGKVVRRSGRRSQGACWPRPATRRARCAERQAAGAELRLPARGDARVQE